MVHIYRPTRRPEELGFVSLEQLLLSVKGTEIRCNYSSSSCDWSKLPADMWFEILCRVPYDDVGRFKSVCKLWNDLIVNACMPKMFASTRLCGFIFKVINGKYEPEPSLDYKIHKPYMAPLGFVGPVALCSALLPFTPSVADFLGYCNGLHMFIQGFSQQYYVCNDATRQCVAIPTCSEVRNFSFNSLAFDPCRSPHFKIICFNSVSPSIKYYIFSSDTCRWDMHQVPLEHPATRHGWYQQSVYCNDVLYRLSESKHIICLDINRMNACAVDLPYKDGTDFSGLTLERGHVYYSNYDCNNIFIWMLEGYGSWILMHKICHRDLYASPIDGTWTFWDFPKTPCFIYFPAGPSSSIIFTGTPDILVTYNLSKRKVCRYWKVKSSERMAYGQYTFWPHRWWRNLLYLKCFDQ